MDKQVAIVVTVYGKPPRLASLIDNMRWAGVPDIPLYIFQDPMPGSVDVRKETTAAYERVVKEKGLGHFETAPRWGCMQGIIQYAMEKTREDWIIYIPDDVIFTRGALWNEYAGVLAYGRDFVGGIQAPFWNAIELVDMGAMPCRDIMFRGWVPEGIPRNPHWDGFGLPRKYINLNGAGFSLNRRLWEKMGGFPQCTWRLDEWAGYQAWKQGMVCITLPGPCRIHYLGGSTPDLLKFTPKYDSVENWQLATGGLSPTETGIETQRIMDEIGDGLWPGILSFFNEGGSLMERKAQCA